MKSLESKQSSTDHCLNMDHHMVSAFFATLLAVLMHPCYILPAVTQSTFDPSSTLGVLVMTI